MEKKITLKNVDVKEFTKFIKRVSVVNQSIQLKINNDRINAIAIPQTTNSFMKYVSMPIEKVATYKDSVNIDIDLLNVNKLLTALNVSQDSNDNISVDIVYTENRANRISIYNSLLKINIPCAMSNIIGVPDNKINALLVKDDGINTVFEIDNSEMKRIKDLFTISNVSNKVFIQLFDNNVFVSEIETDDGTQDKIRTYIQDEDYRKFNELEKVYSKTLTADIDKITDTIQIYDKKLFSLIDDDPKFKFNLFDNMAKIETMNDSVETITFIMKNKI